MSRQKFVNIILVSIAIIALGFGGYFYYKLKNIETNSPENIQKQTDDLLSKVAKLTLIPAGEEPTVATVSDPNKLKDQSFFKQSQKGDKVLIFSKAGRAVLYRPSINKIIETSPINNTNDQTNNPSETTTGPLKDKSF